MRPADVADRFRRALIKTKRFLAERRASRRPHGRAEEADPASARTSWSDFRPAYASFPTITPYRTRYAVGVASLPPFLPAARRRTVSIASRRGGERWFHGCYGNRRKASPGIVRNNYPALNSARSRALRDLLFFSWTARRLANRLRR